MSAPNAAESVNRIRTGPLAAPSVILVHPVGLDLTYWDRQIEALHVDHDVVAYDLPGHGDTPGTPGDWTFDRQAKMLADVVRSLGEERAHVVGISVGGMIAQVFALAHPHLVRSLSLIGTASAFPDEGRRAMRDRAATARRDGMTGVLAANAKRWFTPQTMTERPDIIDRVRKTLLARDPLVHASIWEMITGLDVTSRLGEIACPTLVLVGDADPSCPPAASHVLHQAIAGSRLAVLPATSHMSILERPMLVNQHLADFLHEIERA